MANSSNSAVCEVTPIQGLRWSTVEKIAARKAFDLALERELETVVQEAKDLVAKIETPSELWELERCLTERRQEIERKFDYRYSVLPLVFATLLREGRLSENDLAGLGSKKIDHIRRFAAV